jgi:hypothetical protein
MLAPATFALLSLLAVEPRLALDLRLSPPLALASQHEQAPPDLAPPLFPDPPAPRSIGGATVRAALGFVVGDLLAAGFVTVGISQMAFSCVMGCDGNDDDSAGALIAAGGLTWLFVSPALAVRFARGGGQGSFAKAYWLAFLLRAAAAASLALDEPGVAIVAATELVLAPLVIAKVLDATADDWRNPEVEPVAALAYATPERDPAGPRGR